MRLIDADAYIEYINTALNDALNGATTPSGIMSCMAIVKGIEDDLRNEKITPTIEPQRNPDEWCTDCKEYDSEKHCCPRFNHVIRKTLEHMSNRIRELETESRDYENKGDDY